MLLLCYNTLITDFITFYLFLQGGFSMYWDKRKLGMGIAFLICTCLCILAWIRQGFSSYYLTGSILFTIVGVGFIRSARNG